MSFSFAAVGTKDDVVAQLGAASITTSDHRFNEVAVDLRDLLVKHFEAETLQPYGSSDYRYTVKASGHGGGNVPLSLQVTVEPHWIPVPAAPEAVPDAAGQ